MIRILTLTRSPNPNRPRRAMVSVNEKGSFCGGKISNVNSIIKIRSFFCWGATAPQTPRYDLSGTPNAKQGFGWGKLEIN